MDIEQLAPINGFTLCYSEPPSMRQTAADRFIFRVYALLEDKDLPQKDLRGTKSEGWISSKLKGHRTLKLNEAEEIAERLQYPLAELLRRPEDRVYELDNLEARLVDAFRQLTAVEQEAFLTMITLRQRPAPYASGRKVATVRAKPTEPKGAAHGGPASHRPAVSREQAEALLRQALDNILGPGFVTEQTQAAGGHRALDVLPRGKTGGPPSK